MFNPCCWSLFICGFSVSIRTLNLICQQTWLHITSLSNWFCFCPHSCCSCLFQRNVCKVMGAAVTSVQWSPAKGWCVRVPPDSILALTTEHARQWTTALLTWNAVRYANSIKLLSSAPVILAGDLIQMERAATVQVFKFLKLIFRNIYFCWNCLALAPWLNTSNT